MVAVVNMLSGLYLLVGGSTFGSFYLVLVHDIIVQQIVVRLEISVLLLVGDKRPRKILLMVRMLVK